MGAWGTGPFENDDAADFAGRLTELTDASTVAVVIGDALLAAGAAAGYLEVGDMSCAVAAASLVAVLAGADLDEQWPLTRNWLDTIDLEAHDLLRQEALAVFERAFDPKDNEWFELWDEAGAIDELRQGLAPYRTALS